MAWRIGPGCYHFAMATPPPAPAAANGAAASAPLRHYLYASLAVGAVALLGAPLLGQFDLANIAMLFPLAVLFAAIRLGRGPAVFAAFLSVALFDFFFVHPHFTLAVSDLQYLLTFAVLLAVALTTAELVARLRRERDSAEARAEETAQARLAVESERLRNTLLTSLSHDLRTPLTALAGLAESLPLAGPPLPPAQAELAEAIRAEALRTHALARDLLDLARLQSETPRLALDWLAVDELVGSALQARAHALRGHTLTLALAADLPLLHADAALMERVMCNLIDNAIAHTPAGGRIMLRARTGAADAPVEDDAPSPCSAAPQPPGPAHDRPARHGIEGPGADAGAALRAGSISISVCDDGCGLPPGREQAIFERFVRTPHPHPPCAGTAVTGDGGTGLGLAIVRAIVEAHGGAVAARNRAGGGACFTLCLPLPPQPELPPPEGGETEHGR
jgi:two-component system sensor histidine kinase KdpD